MNVEIRHAGMNFPIGDVVDGSVFGKSLNDHLAIGSVRMTTRPPTIVSSLASMPTEQEAALEHLKATVVETEGKLATETNRSASLRLDLEKLEAALEKEIEDHGKLKTEFEMLKTKYEGLLSAQTNGGPIIR